MRIDATLVQSIDLGAVRLIERNILEGLPSVDEIFNLFGKVKSLFDGQEVDGKYFDSKDKLTLPKKQDIEKLAQFLPSQNKTRGNIGKWFYTIIDSKSDDEKILKLIESFKYENYDAFWIISPWGFSNNLRKVAKEKAYIYLSSHSSLGDLYNALKKDTSS